MLPNIFPDILSGSVVLLIIFKMLMKRHVTFAFLFTY
jgi:hypothetical protein